MRNHSELLAADTSDSVFVDELLRATAEPGICAVIEGALRERKAIWGTQAGFAQFANSTYFPLLACVSDPQNRPEAVSAAANAGNTNLTELYCRSLGLPEFYRPRIAPRIQEHWQDRRCSVMVLEIIFEERWRHAADLHAYIRSAALRAFVGRQTEAEQEHIRSIRAGVILQNFDESREIEAVSASIQEVEFRLDFEAAVRRADNVGTPDQKFVQVLTDLVLSGFSWAQIATRYGVAQGESKQFATQFRRRYHRKLACFREVMAAYHRPEHKTAEERLAAARRSLWGASRKKI